LQRPADPKGYAVKVDNALKGMPAELNAPIDSSAATSADDSATPPSQVSSSPSFASTYLKGYLGYDKDPVMSSLYDSFYANKQEAETPKTSTTTQTSDQPAGTKGKLGDYKDIVELAKKWGLNIQGDFQTTGGKHAPNSRHYAGKAADFGDATNSPERMKQFAAYLARNAGTYGINNLYYTPLGWSLEGQGKTKKTIGGHGDHLHVDVF
jgi:hypothetical protein